MARPDALGRRFWVLWAAGAVSYAGDGVTAGALPLLAASISRDPRVVSTVQAVTTLGWVLLGLASGVVVDRVDKLALMWRVDVLRAFVTSGFAVLILSGRSSLALLLGAGFLLGLAAPFFDNASASVLPEIVDTSRLERANAVVQGSMSVGVDFVGPPLGAALFVLAHGAPFVVDAASFLASAVLVLLLARRRRRTVHEVSAGSPWGQLAEGMRFLAGDRVLRSLAVSVGMINAVVGGIVAVLVLFVLEVLHLPEAAYGWVVSAFAVGGITGAVTASRVIRAVGQRASVLMSLTGFAASATLLGLASTVPVVVVLLGVAGWLGTLWNVVTLSYRQRVVPPPLLGRVTSVYRMVAFIAMPVGAAGAGLLAHVLGIPHTYLAGGLLLFVGIALAAPPLRGLPGRAGPGSAVA